MEFTTAPPPSSATPINPTLLFAAGILWVFIFAEVFDEVRHGHENLFIGFGIPIWLAACGASLGLQQWIWRQFPHLMPRADNLRRTALPELVGTLTGLALAFAWGKSPLYALVYDSIKWMGLLIIAGWTLGAAFRWGGLKNIVNSLLIALIGALSTSAALLLIALFMTRKEILEGSLAFARLGIPFTVAVSLYDCSQTAKKKPLTTELECPL